VKHSLLIVVLAACLPQPPSPNSPEVQAQQKAAFAQSMGYPTRKTAEQLDAEIARQTKKFKRDRTGQARLEAFEPFHIDGVEGTCYTLVMRLGAGAAWGPAGDYVSFDFTSPTGKGSGGPGVIGPGAIASVGCAEASGPIALTMRPMVGADPIGQGALELELWSHKLTPEEAAHLEADKQRQIAEQREFARQEALREQQRLSHGCAKCDGRYQGCVGAGRSRQVCRDEYSSCAFREAGADYLSACPSPSY
jgi:hypothetical protein